MLLTPKQIVYKHVFFFFLLKIIEKNQVYASAQDCSPPPFTLNLEFGVKSKGVSLNDPQSLWRDFTKEGKNYKAKTYFIQKSTGMVRSSLLLDTYYLSILLILSFYGWRINWSRMLFQNSLYITWKEIYLTSIKLVKFN